MATTAAHPINGAVARMQSLLDELAEVPTWSMSQAATAEAMVDIARLEARVVELKSRTLVHAETVAVQERNASPSLAVWQANATRSTKRESFRQVRLAAGLNRYDVVREALGRGDVIAEQASVICTALDELPDDLDATVLEQAAKALVAFAEVHDAKALRVLGRRILEVVAPEVAEAWEAEQLDREEREAEKSSVFRMREDGHGRIKGSFTVPLLVGQMLERALLAFAAPKHQIATREAEEEQSEAPVPVRRPTAQRLGAAVGFAHVAYLECRLGHGAARTEEARILRDRCPRASRKLRVPAQTLGCRSLCAPRRCAVLFARRFLAGLHWAAASQPARRSVPPAALRAPPAAQ